MMKRKISLFLEPAKEVLLPLLTIFLCFFLGIKFLIPKIFHLIDFHRQLKENESQVIKLEEKADFLESQKEVSSSFEKVTRVLPDGKDVAGLLLSLENLKKETGLDFGSFSLRPGLLATQSAALRVGSEKEIKFEIPFSSSYQELLEFLEKIEETAPLTSVDNVKINFESGKEKIEGSLSLKTHYFPVEEKTEFKPEDPLPLLSPSLEQTLEKVLAFKIFPYETFLPEEEIGKKNPFQETSVVEEEAEVSATESASSVEEEF